MAASENQANRYLLYQLRIQSDFALSAPIADDRPCDYEFVRADSWLPRPFKLSEQTHCYHSPQSGADLHAAGAEICLRYPEIADFYFDGAKRVTCHVAPSAAEPLLISLLQGPVCAVLLELRGMVCLHASAVQVGDRVIAFLGNSGSGKSSLATAFVSRGYALVSDDILAVSVIDGACMANPGYPQLKLCADLAAAPPLAGATVHGGPLPRTADSTTQKQLQPVGQGWGSFASHPLRLAAAYVLEREPMNGQQGLCPKKGSGPFIMYPGMERTTTGRGPDPFFGQSRQQVTIESLPARDGFVELLRFSFCAGALGPLGLESSRFHELGRIAELVQVRRLRYDSGFENFPTVLDAVLCDISS